MSNALDVTNATFDAEVVKSSVPVLVDFWAPWCHPCKVIAPIIDAVAQDMAGKIKVTKVNVDENRQLADRFGVMSIPALIIFKGGTAVNRIVGLMTKEQITQKLNEVIG
jgi:thioredoxin 1